MAEEPTVVVGSPSCTCIMRHYAAVLRQLYYILQVTRAAKTVVDSSIRSAAMPNCSFSYIPSVVFLLYW